MRDILPTAALRFDVAVPEFEEYLRNRDIHGCEKPNPASSIRVCFASGGIGPGQASTLTFGLVHYVLPARSCGADLEDSQNVFRTLCRSWTLAIPAEIRTPVSCEILLNVAMSGLLYSVPKLFSFRLIVRCFQPKPGGFHGTAYKHLMTQCQHVTKKFMASSISEILKRADWQIMQLSNAYFWTVPESLIYQTVISVPDHDSLQQLGHSLLLPLHLPQRQLRSFGVSHQRHMAVPMPHWDVTSDCLSQVRHSPVWITIYDFLFHLTCWLCAAGPNWNHSKLCGSFAAL